MPQGTPDGTPHAAMGTHQVRVRLSPREALGRRMRTLPDILRGLDFYITLRAMDRGMEGMVYVDLKGHITQEEWQRLSTFIYSKDDFSEEVGTALKDTYSSLLAVGDVDPKKSNIRGTLSAIRRQEAEE